MRKQSLVILLLMAAVSVVGLMAPVHADAGTPVAVIENATFDFGDVYEGTDVVHDFIIQNKGDADLEIVDVKAGWGCSTVSRPEKPIPPGGEDTITFKLSTKTYGGRPVKKSIKVYTNDPDNEKIILQLAGKVKKFVTIKPSKVFLKGNVGENISQTISIIPGDDEVFKILQVNPLKGGDYKYDLKEVELDGKKAYELTVENTREIEGRYFDKIFMITDRTDQAPLSIIVSGYLTKAPVQEPEEEPVAVPENKPEPSGD